MQANRQWHENMRTEKDKCMLYCWIIIFHGFYFKIWHFNSSDACFNSWMILISLKTLFIDYPSIFSYCLAVLLYSYCIVLLCPIFSLYVFLYIFFYLDCLKATEMEKKKQEWLVRVSGVSNFFYFCYVWGYSA